MKLEEIKQKIINFYDYSDEEQENILGLIYSIASASDKQNFINEIRILFPQFEFSGISVVYEALTKNPDDWGDFFVEEFQRAFKEAEDTFNPAQILGVLEEIGAMPSVKFDFAHEIITILLEYVNYEDIVIQYYAIYYLGDWLGDGNINNYFALVHNLEDIVKEHSNWKIRNISFTTLWLNKAVPKGLKLSLMDKLRAKFLNPFKIT